LGNGVSGVKDIRWRWSPGCLL